MIASIAERATEMNVQLTEHPDDFIPMFNSMVSWLYSKNSGSMDKLKYLQSIFADLGTNVVKLQEWLNEIIKLKESL